MTENIFISSSQAQNWMFASVEDLQKLKEDTNVEAREHFKTVFEMERVKAIQGVCFSTLCESFT